MITDWINIIIVQGYPAPNSYSCNGPNNSPEFRHWCQCCGRWTPCSFLSTSALGLLECELCINAGWVLNGKKLQNNLVQSAGTEARREAQSLGSDDLNARDVENKFMRTKAALREFYFRVEDGGVTVFDMYTSKWMWSYPNGESSTRTPFTTGRAACSPIHGWNWR